MGHRRVRVGASSAYPTPLRYGRESPPTITVCTQCARRIARSDAIRSPSEFGPSTSTVWVRPVSVQRAKRLPAQAPRTANGGETAMYDIVHTVLKPNAVASPSRQDGRLS